MNRTSLLLSTFLGTIVFGGVAEASSQEHHAQQGQRVKPGKSDKKSLNFQQPIVPTAIPSPTPTVESPASPVDVAAVAPAPVTPPTPISQGGEPASSSSATITPSPSQGVQSDVANDGSQSSGTSSWYDWITVAGNAAHSIASTVGSIANGARNAAKDGAANALKAAKMTMTDEDLIKRQFGPKKVDSFLFPLMAIIRSKKPNEPIDWKDLLHVPLETTVGSDPQAPEYYKGWHVINAFSYGSVISGEVEGVNVSCMLVENNKQSIEEFLRDFPPNVAFTQSWLTTNVISTTDHPWSLAYDHIDYKTDKFIGMRVVRSQDKKQIWPEASDPMQYQHKKDSHIIQHLGLKSTVNQLIDISSSHSNRGEAFKFPLLTLNKLFAHIQGCKEGLDREAIAYIMAPEGRRQPYVGYLQIKEAKNYKTSKNHQGLGASDVSASPNLDETFEQTLERLVEAKGEKYFKYAPQGRQSSKKMAELIYTDGDDQLRLTVIRSQKNDFDKYFSSTMPPQSASARSFPSQDELKEGHNN